MRPSENYHRLLSIICIIFLLCLLQCNDQNEMDILNVEERNWLIEHKNELTFAPDPHYAPFEFYDEKEKHTNGLANDFIKLIEKKLDIKFKIIRAKSFTEILTLAKEKKVAIVNAVTETPERSEYLLFTKPFVEIPNVIISRTKNDRSLSLSNIGNNKFTVIKGYAVTEYLLKKYPTINFDIVENDLQAILQVAYNQSDGAVLDIASSLYHADKMGITNLKVVGNVNFPIKLAIGSRKDLPELNNILNKALLSITLEERNIIENKWIRFQETNILKNKNFWYIVLSILSFFILASTFIILWNRQLKKQVNVRTWELSTALNQKQLAEEKILHSLHEKETLILELFHRTKNTMEVIRSFLFLQSANSTNKELLKLVKDTSNRIIAISLVHEKLYNSNNLSSINCKEYIEELINLIIPNYKDPMKKIILTTELENIQILIDTAIPCGLILNELLSNSLKYAFPNNGFGNIIITLSKLDRELLKLTYSDNGIGIPKDFDYRIQNTLGMQIIYSLGEQQLGGKVSFDTNHGVNFSLEFPTTLYTSRV